MVRLICEFLWCTAISSVNGDSAKWCYAISHKESGSVLVTERSFVTHAYEEIR